MFKIVESRRAWWPVTWPGVTEDEHKIVENRIELRFILLDDDQNFELLQETASVQTTALAKLSAGEKVKLSELKADLVEKIACDWRHVAAENGDPLAWSRENLVRLLKISGVYDAAMAGYRACLTGRAEIRAGN